MFSEAQILETRPNLSRGLLRKRFLEERQVMESLCQPLSAEECMLSATEDTSPPKWHLAHTTWFYEHFILMPHDAGYDAFDLSFEFLFNSYYRAVGEFLPKSKRILISRPSLEKVLEYRKSVTEQVAELLASATGDNLRKISELVELGINHEQQHQELLLMDIKRNFFDVPSRPAYLSHFNRVTSGTASTLHFNHFSGGLVEIGNHGEGFHYDNEAGKHRVFLEPFSLSNRMINNAEFLDFIHAGGYQQAQFWLSDGWDFIQKENIRAPLYWILKDDQYWQMTLQGMRLIDPAEPVSHVSYYEAQAFAAFKGARLPSESEWEFAAGSDRERTHFMEEAIYHPVASNTFHGSLWEWTQSAYLPYPGYQAFDQGLFEYNSKFMCNQFVLRGGSCVTPASHYRLTYRNFFYPQMRWQFSGFRLAKDSL